MTPKKILLATRPLVQPWDEASKNFAYFLGREIRDHNLTLLTTPAGVPDIPANSHEEQIFHSNSFGLQERIILLEYLRRVRKQFDITHYLFTPTLLNTNLIRAFAKPLRGKTIQTVATLRQDLYSDKDLKKMLFADRIVVYTEHSKRKLESLGMSNVERIYPGIDLIKYSPEPKFPALLSSFGLDKSHFIAIYPGEYARLGATDMLARNFIQYFKDNPGTNVRFFFACRVKNSQDRKKKEEVQELFSKAGVMEYVRFTDTIADMPSLYNLADVVLFPVENLNGKFDVPLVILEAYACAKPVILSDLHAFLEFAGKEFSVIIPKASGPNVLASLAYLKDNPDVGTELGKQARAFVEANFDLTKTASQYSELYASL